MKELDVVRLRRLEGTVVTVLDGRFYDVEFVDAKGNTIALVTLPAELLEVKRRTGRVAQGKSIE